MATFQKGTHSGEINSPYKYNEGYLFVNKIKTNTRAKRKTHSRYSVSYYEFYLNKYYIYDNTIDKGLLDPFIKLLVASKRKRSTVSNHIKTKFILYQFIES